MPYVKKLADPQTAPSTSAPVDIKSAKSSPKTLTPPAPKAQLPNPIAPDIRTALRPRLRMKDITRLLGLSHATIYKRIAAGTFPEPDGRDGPRVVWWREETIKKFL